MLQTGNQSCKTCNTQLQGDYCHVCGEKLLRAEDKTAKKWLADLLSNIWMLDGKLFNTLKLLLLKPGRFASDYAEGIRKPYVKPLNLFLLANLLYFLTAGFDTFKTDLNTQMVGMPYGRMVEGIVESRYGSPEERSEAYQAYEIRYNAKTDEVSKLIIIVLAPLLGFLFYALFRTKGLFLSDAFNLALQFWTFFILVLLLMLRLIFRLLTLLIGSGSLFVGGNHESLLTGLVLALSSIYVYFQFSQMEGKKLILLAKTAIVILAFLPLVFTYRFILFWVTYWLV